MHGPKHAYAVNGHGRYLTMYTAEGQYITGMSVSGPSITAMIGKAVLEITRAQAAEIIRKHRAAGHVVKTEFVHSKFCECRPNDSRMIPHYTCAYDAPCKTERKAS